MLTITASKLQGSYVKWSSFPLCLLHWMFLRSPCRTTKSHYAQTAVSMLYWRRPQLKPCVSLRRPIPYRASIRSTWIFSSSEYPSQSRWTSRYINSFNEYVLSLGFRFATCWTKTHCNSFKAKLQQHEKCSDLYWNLTFPAKAICACKLLATI